MTREEALLLPIGSLLLTPWEPRAKVKLVAVESDTAQIVFTHEHRGYAAGSLGRYFLNELTPIPTE